MAAADLLRLSPSAVSQQVRLLEKEAGVRVLDRTPTGAVLTESGRVLAETAERIESERATARRELALVDGDVPAGIVRIGSFATAIRALLLPLLLALEESMPGIEVIIEEVEERAALAQLRQGALDLALLERDSHTLPAPPRAMNDVPLLDESWLVVVPPGQAAPSTLSDLVRATWIDLDPATAGAFALARLSRQLGTPLSTRHVVDDYDVVLAMVGQGLGYAILPELAVHSSPTASSSPACPAWAPASSSCVIVSPAPSRPVLRAPSWRRCWCAPRPSRRAECRLAMTLVEIDIIE